MPAKKATHSVRQFKGPAPAASASSTKKSSVSPATSAAPQGVPVSLSSYAAFLFNYLHFTKEERGNRGEGVLRDDALNVTTTHDAEFYALLVKLAKDVRILSANSSVDESNYTPAKCSALFSKIFNTFIQGAPQRDPKTEKKIMKRMKNFVEMVESDTVHRMVQFLVNYKFNQCQGVNLTVLRIQELLNNLGRVEPKWNVQMVESGLISGWLIRILKQDAEESTEAIEVYRVFAMQWLNVIVSEYQLFRRRAKERAVSERQKKIEEKRAAIKDKKKKRDEEEERRRKEFEQKIQEEMELEEEEEEEEAAQEQTETTTPRKNRKKKRTYDDDHLFEPEQEEDDDEAELAELERLEKEEDDGSDDPNVQKLRTELFDETFVDVVVDLLKSLPEYEDEDNYVLICQVPEANPQKPLTHEEHVAKCNKTFFQQLLHICNELLTSTYTFDEDVFNSLVQSMIDRNVQCVFSYTFRNVNNPNVLRRSFNLLYFLLHCEERSVRLALVPHLLMVMEILQSTVDENATTGKVRLTNENLTIACLYILSYITCASAEVTAQIYEQNPDVFDTLIVLFKERPFDAGAESSTIILYGCVSSFVRYGIDTNTLLTLDERWQFTDDVINDAQVTDSRLRFPAIVTVRVLIERLESVPMQQAAPIYQKLLDSGVSNVMLQTIFEKRFQQEDEKQEARARANPQYEMSRILHTRFMHPASLCTLNVLLDRTSKSGSPQVNQSLANLVSADQRYIEILQFMRYMQQTREKRFSYRNVFLLIGLIVLVVLLFPLLARLFGVNTSAPLPKV